MIRSATAEDHPAILALNREWEHFLSPMDTERLTQLHALAAWQRVHVSADGIDAFLLAFREGSDYDSSNYRWFDERYPRFLYIDRVVVTGNAQGRGLGQALYQDLFHHAREAGVSEIACEFDLAPPNPASRRFHEALGFREVGCRTYGHPAKQVSLRLLTLGTGEG